MERLNIDRRSSLETMCESVGYGIELKKKAKARLYDIDRTSINTNWPFTKKARTKFHD